MSNRTLFWLVTAAMLLVPSRGMSQQPAIRWEPTLESAQRLAGQTNRLVLIHFSAPWCQHCRWMEAEVFTQPSVAAAIGADYVPVKINADNFPATAKKYGVSKLPTTIVALPDGRPVKIVAERMDSVQYVRLLGYVVADVRQRRGAIYAQIPSGPATTPTQPGSQSAGQPMPQAPNSQAPVQPAAGHPVAAMQPDSRYTGVANNMLPGVTAPSGQASYGYAPGTTIPQPPTYRPPSNGPVATAQPPATTPVWAANNTMPVGTVDPSRRSDVTNAPTTMPSSPIGNMASGGQPAPTAPSVNMPPVMKPPLGLDGFCPVSLCERQKWVAGDPRWGAIHRGRTYLFVGPDEQRRFFSDPDRYAPVVSGNDVVLATEQGQAVPGYRQYGVVFENRVYLFSSEATLLRFARNPKAYASQAIEALRLSAYPGGHGEIR